MEGENEVWREGRKNNIIEFITCYPWCLEWCFIELELGIERF